MALTDAHAFPQMVVVVMLKRESGDDSKEAFATLISNRVFA